mmetsp:Transcript_12169/g.34508  ORF Transcript_12169/g.34508 Transcript_12169/m.34508 type:complete len:281 (-) Transcript_12169:63-905(-)
MQNPNADEERAPLMMTQRAVMVQGEPPKVRQDFVRKALVLMLLQVVLAVGPSLPVLLKWHGFLAAVFRPCSGVVRVVNVIFIVVLGVQFLHQNFAANALKWGRDAYMCLLTTPPWNLMAMALYALLSGLVMAFNTWLVAKWTAIILILVQLVVVVVLSAFAIFTERDFSKTESHHVLRGMIVLTCLVTTLHAPRGLERVLDSLWIIYFLGFLVQHTQLIFGTSRPQNQALQYNIDMYSYAALVLFNIYISVYVCLLRTFQVNNWGEVLTLGLCPEARSTA